MDGSRMGRHRILILGGTTEARELAGALSGRKDCETLLSLAGRTAEPIRQPVPVRSGGFGGSDGLAAYLRHARIDLMIDATHPFAARISDNAVIAARAIGIALFALRRPAWQRQPDDRWTPVKDVSEAVAALGLAPRRVFLAIGRQEAFLFEQAPQHSYLVRSVDPVMPPLALPHLQSILACGPFRPADELQLLRDNRIDVVVAKNSGGTATYAKIGAARELGLDVVMVERRLPADIEAVATVETALDRIDHLLSPEKNRGV